MGKGISRSITIGSIILVAACIAAWGFFVMANQSVVQFLSQKSSSSSVLKRPIVFPPAEKKDEPSSVVINFFGDIMLARNVEARMKQFGTSYPFEKMKPVFDVADLSVANLEGPITTSYVPTPTGSTRFSFKTSTAALLHEQGLDLVSVANNHDLDYSQKGLDQTREFLKQNGVEPFGDPRDASEGFVVMKEVKGYELAFIGFSAYPNLYTDDKVELVRTVAKDPNLFVIVMMHWGDEYQLHSNKQQQEFAHKLIDAGADAVIGAHPHVVQEVEQYKNRAIFYSLGNFIFDQYFSEDTQEELGVEIMLDNATTTYTLMPIQSVASQPRLMQGDAATLFLRDLAKRSGPDIQGQVRAGSIVVRQE